MHWPRTSSTTSSACRPTCSPSTPAATPACSTTCSRAWPPWPRPAGRRANDATTPISWRACRRSCSDTRPWALRTHRPRSRWSWTAAMTVAPAPRRWPCAAPSATTSTTAWTAARSPPAHRATPPRCSSRCRWRCRRPRSSMARHWPRRPAASTSPLPRCCRAPTSSSRSARAKASCCCAWKTTARPRASGRSSTWTSSTRAGCGRMRTWTASPSCACVPDRFRTTSSWPTMSRTAASRPSAAHTGRWTSSAGSAMASRWPA